MFALFFFPLVAPTYIVIYLLTGFEPRQSTPAQRGWIIASFVSALAAVIIIICVECVVRFLVRGFAMVGQARELYFWRVVRHFVPDVRVRGVLGILYRVILYVPPVGAFVVVGQMIMEIETCVRI